ncbi:hypothetical protein FQN57_003304 [Myotisia sp. PD_48]|nr:hypothetical protein FQN57_003304 [Myotisia sp. PD_48]
MTGPPSPQTQPHPQISPYPFPSSSFPFSSPLYKLCHLALLIRCLHAPNPIQWDVPGRIAELQTMIDDPATSEPQKKNLQTAINLYHEKELSGSFRWIQDGKVVPHNNIAFRRSYWVEGYAQQLSTQAMVPSQVSKPVSESVD